MSLASENNFKDLKKILRKKQRLTMISYI